MIREPLVFVATPDFAGKLRGKAFPAAMLKKRQTFGVGWTPTNVQITCFDRIAETPYGALDDLLLVPDPATEVFVDFADGNPAEHFMLGDVRSLQHQPWECCTRSLLKSCLDRLEAISGLRLVAAFEHEFQLLPGVRPRGDAYALDGFRSQAKFLEALMAALKMANLGLDTIMKEYGPEQFEVTITPELGVRAADGASIVRELTRACAARTDQRATFTPIRDPASVGNGVHIHFSFVDANDQPVMYDPAGPQGLSAAAASFAGGVLKYLDSIIALTAPSAISYQRLTPHRWSAAFNNLGLRDREAALRICPTQGDDEAAIAGQYNLEFRAADAAASPHLALAAIVAAGTQGIIDQLPAPLVTEQDLSLLAPGELQALGLQRLPQTLAEALARFNANPIVREWFPGQFCAIYHAHKLAELDFVSTMSVAEQCAAYEEVY